MFEKRYGQVGSGRVGLGSAGSLQNELELGPIRIVSIVILVEIEKKIRFQPK